MQEERIWIIKKFGELKSPTKVKRAFHISFLKQYSKSIPTWWQFQKVIETLDASGDVGEQQVKPRVRGGIPQCDVQAVKDDFTLNDNAHIREAVWDLGYSIGKIWFIFEENSEMEGIQTTCSNST